VTVASVLIAIVWMGVSGLARRDAIAWMREWPDLVLVQVCCAWPVACVLHRLLPSGGGGMACVLACGVVAAGAACGPATGFLSGMLQRGIAAAFAVMAAQGIIAWLTRHAEAPPSRPTSALRVVATSLLCLLLPGLYAWHQSERELDQMGTLIGRQRPVAAVRTSERVQSIRPEATWNGQPMRAITQELSARIAEAREHLAVSASWSLPARQLERCRLLAAVDQWDEAVTLARTLAEEPEVAVAASLMLASLFEERNDWTSCRSWYATALRHLDDPQHSRSPFRTTALQGLGFAEQNLGHHVAAEVAFLESLQGGDDAGSHVLLSGLYADAQNLRAAQTHATLAVESDPNHQATLDRLKSRAARDGFCRPQPSSTSSARTPSHE
jgi:hypothetical protein